MLSPLYTIRKQQRNRGEMTKNDVHWIVYQRRLLCFTNRFFAIHCMQDLRQGNGLVEEYKIFFRRKKIVYQAKIDGEQRTVYSNFRQQCFIWQKNNFVPYSSCLRIVYSGFTVSTHAHLFAMALDYILYYMFVPTSMSALYCRMRRVLYAKLQTVFACVDGQSNSSSVNSRANYRNILNINYLGKLWETSPKF